MLKLLNSKVTGWVLGFVVGMAAITGYWYVKPHPIDPEPEVVTTAGIKIIDPEKPIVSWDMAQFVVEGIKDKYLPQAQVYILPEEGVKYIPSLSWRPGGKPYIVFQARSGTYDIVIAALDGSNSLITTKKTVIVQRGPGPDPGPGPGPDPGPHPPGPTKLRVLVLWDDTKISPEQSAMIYSTAPGSVRDYCNNHCLLERKGDVDLPTARYWRLDPDTIASFSTADPEWRKLLDASESYKPGIIIQAGDVIKRFDLPSGTADALAILKQYGG